MLQPSLRYALRAASLAAVLLLPALPLHAAGNAMDNAVARINSGIHSASQVALSPDGSRLAWTQTDSGGAEIRVAPLQQIDGSHRITAASSMEQHCNESDPIWSPDSRSLAFLSDCAHPGAQKEIYIAPLDGAPARQLTALHGYVQAPAFSPDGSKIAFLYVEGSSRPAGALAAQTLPSGVIGEDSVEIQRIASVPADAAQPSSPTYVSPADLHAYEFNWSPDSQSMAYVAADPPGENNWWVARLYIQATDGKPKAILNPSTVTGPLHGLQIAMPRWSPDGKTIAFIGGLMSDQGVTGGDIWTVPSAGGQPRNLTPQRPTSSLWIAWAGDSHIASVELAGGDSRLIRLALNAPSNGEGVARVEPSPLPLPGSVGGGLPDSSISATANGSLLVFTASSFEHPPEIYAARPEGAKQLVQLTHWNNGVRPAWGQSMSMNWTNGGFHVQGWLLLPKDYDPAKKYPLLVEVHGGPAWAVMSRWNGGAGGFSATAFSALGYFVLMPNPRGSFGQGQAFTQANRKDFGYGDLHDILAGVDAVEARYPVDPRRVGLAGWSYGGFMSMFAVTQTHRFRAAVAGAGISDWRSYYGENSIDQWMIPYFGASVYDDPAVYAKSSAINFIKRASTPTLVVVGDRDGECPAPQSFEFWHALRDQHVPVQLVVYPNEGHGFRDPAHRRDVLLRAEEWFARYMPPNP